MPCLHATSCEGILSQGTPVLQYSQHLPTCGARLPGSALGLGLEALNLELERVEARVELGIGIGQLLDLLPVGERICLGRRETAGHCSNGRADHVLCRICREQLWLTLY